MILMVMVVIQEVLQEETGGKVINMLIFACSLAKAITKETGNKINNEFCVCACAGSLYY